MRNNPSEIASCKALPLLLIALFPLSCAGVKIENGTFTNFKHEFTVRIPGNDWEILDVEDVPLTLKNKNNGSIIAINRSCGRKYMLDADPLASRLFVTFEKYEIISRKPAKAGGLEGIEIEAVASNENVSNRIRALVLPSDECVYDIFYVVSEELRDAGPGPFDDLISSFTVKPER